MEGSWVSRQGRPRPEGSGKGRTLKVFISSLHRLTSERKYRGILSPVPSAIYTLASFVWSLSNISCNVRDRQRQSQCLRGGERLGDFSPALRRLVRGADAARGTQAVIILHSDTERLSPTEGRFNRVEDTKETNNNNTFWVVRKDQLHVG